MDRLETGLENLTGLATEFVNTFHGVQPARAQPARAQPSNGQQATPTNSLSVRSGKSRRGDEEVPVERMQQRDLPARQQLQQVWRRLVAQGRSESRRSQMERMHNSMLNRLARPERSDEEVDSAWTPLGLEEPYTTDLRDRLNTRCNIPHGVPTSESPKRSSTFNKE
ncbi:hypothetical protein TIFTF001_008639 [Ficus carica]|uniref:Uncharacterized protein n=1 Tax=Ficus carica TaxID=3494 RepID=A0AA87ZLS5_FICCA|nr:hypothetical protein TIFTF001_008639 [Ficus carica]